MRIIKFSEHDKTDEYSISPDISRSEKWEVSKKIIKTGGDSSKKTQAQGFHSVEDPKNPTLSHLFTENGYVIESCGFTPMTRS